jgi:phosphoribosyl-ATP pyrophosphohydrolase
MSNFAAVLEQLWATVEARQRTPSDGFWTSKLVADPALAAKKLAEEAVETALAAVQGDRPGVVAESADLIYHWLALLAALGLTPDEVGVALAARQGRSGLEEKASRP